MRTTIRGNRACARGLVLALTLMAGCTNATVIGTACKTAGECNVAGQVCAPGFNAGATICTRKCTGNTGTMGCPVGYECYPTDPAQGATCNKVLYEVDAKTGAPQLIGHDCGLNEPVCMTLTTTNAGAICRKVPDESADPVVAVEQDPNAYCTGSCTTDFDCPLEFRCATDYDMKKKCLKRTSCAECVVDANCPTDFPICIPTKDGTSRYCTKTCAAIGDCGGTQNSAQDCQNTTNAAGGAVMACVQRFGACVGTGNICDPCRTKDDCAKSKSSCAMNPGTGERMCTKQCATDADCMPFGTVKAVCDNTDVYNKTTNPGGMSSQLCNGDVMHTTPGLFSCWVPQ